MKKLIVIGSGSGEADNITLRALDYLEHADHILVATKRMPLWQALINGELHPIALDACYDQAEDFNALNESIYEALKKQEGTVCYVVYGNALSNETAAYAIAAAKKEKLETLVVPGVSLSDTASAAWQSFGSKRVLTATDALQAFFNVHEKLIITEIDNKLLAGDLKCRLLEQYNGELKVECYVENELGQGSVSTLTLSELDRLSTAYYNQTSCIYIDAVELLNVHKYDFEHLLGIMKTLRGKNGCPWDKEQTHQSLERYLIEEAYETVDAIRQEDMDKLYDELGDVLLQVVFHAQIAKEYSEFNMLDVTNAVCRKMITRHPHIFADTKVQNSTEVLQNWETIKKKEKNISTYAQVMEDVPKSMPALLRAFKIGQKAKHASFDWNTAQEAAEKLEEELKEFMCALHNNDEANAAEEIGDLLFSMVNTSRLAGIQPEIALNAAVDKFIKRFTAMEENLRKEGCNMQQMPFEELNEYWNMVKKEEF